MTSTISTVGFGDISGYQDEGEKWLAEMSYLFFIMSIGMIMFAYVKNEIFDYKQLKTVQ